MAYDLQAYDSASPYEPRLTTPGSSDVASEISQCLESTGETLRFGHHATFALKELA
jgi:hypothetical protein